MHVLRRWTNYNIGALPCLACSRRRSTVTLLRGSFSSPLPVRHVISHRHAARPGQPVSNVMQCNAMQFTGTLPDPGDQLCTDDFAGASPHNVNLAAKGVVGVGAFARLLSVAAGGDDDADDDSFAQAAQYRATARALAANWTAMARDDANGTHSRLQYDLNGTWSLKCVSTTTRAVFFSPFLFSSCLLLFPFCFRCPVFGFLCSPSGSRSLPSASSRPHALRVDVFVSGNWLICLSFVFCSWVS